MRIGNLERVSWLLRVVLFLSAFLSSCGLSSIQLRGASLTVGYGGEGWEHVEAAGAGEVAIEVRARHAIINYARPEPRFVRMQLPDKTFVNAHHVTPLGNAVFLLPSATGIELHIDDPRFRPLRKEFEAKSNGHIAIDLVGSCRIELDVTFEGRGANAEQPAIAISLMNDTFPASVFGEQGGAQRSYRYSWPKGRVLRNHHSVQLDLPAGSYRIEMSLSGYGSKWVYIQVPTVARVLILEVLMVPEVALEVDLDGMRMNSQALPRKVVLFQEGFEATDPLGYFGEVHGVRRGLGYEYAELDVQLDAPTVLKGVEPGRYVIGLIDEYHRYTAMKPIILEGTHLLVTF
jgi:hypothetical protein